MDLYIAWAWVTIGFLLSIPTLLLLNYFKDLRHEPMDFGAYFVAFIRCIAFGPLIFNSFWSMFSIWLKLRKRNDSCTEGSTT